MIVKTRKYSSEFTTVPNKPINDKELSYEALGVWLYLMSKPDDWNVQMDDLRNRTKRNGAKYGRDLMQGILKELKQYGLAELVPIRDENGIFIGKSWVISDITTDERVSRQSEKPTVGKTDGRKTRQYNNKESLLIKNNNKDRENKEALSPEIEKEEIIKATNQKAIDSQNRKEEIESLIKKSEPLKSEETINPSPPIPASPPSPNFWKYYGTEENLQLLEPAIMNLINNPNTPPIDWAAIDKHIPGYFARTSKHQTQNTKKPWRKNAINYLRGMEWLTNPNPITRPLTQLPPRKTGGKVLPPRKKRFA